MNRGTIAALLATTLLGAVAGMGCTVTAGASNSGGDQRGTGSEASTAPDRTSPAGRCKGIAVDAARMQDVTSCGRQGGDWHRPTTQPGSCWAPANNSCASRTGYDAGATGDWGKADCLQILGCVWENPDGTELAHPDLGGSCSGEPVACTELAQNGCNADSNCEWSFQAGVCGFRDIYERKQRDCEFEVSTDVTTMTTHPQEASWACISRPGCVFTRRDGSIRSK